MKVVKRPYQVRGENDLRASYGRGKKAPMFVLATGGGKTVTFAGITEGAAAKGKRILIIAHRRELIKQASRKLDDIGVRHGIISPGHSQTSDLVQVGSIQTVMRRLDKMPRFDLIIIDEAHHAIAGGYMQLIQSQPQAKLLGVTASPERLDGRGLGDHAGGCFDDLILGPQSAELIEDGYLTPIRVFAPAHGPDLSGIKTRGGDYAIDELAKVMSARSIVGDACAEYAKHAPGQPAIVFCVSVEHAKVVAAAFRNAGWRAVAIDGASLATERDAALGGLSTGAVQVLCVCDIVSEGLDVVGISVVILLRATKSLVNFIQWIGRGLRPVYAPGMPLETAAQRRAAIAASSKPHCLVLDNAGCVMHHGFPTEHRDWSLDGRPKKEAAPPTRQCPECFAIFKPAPVCPECGHSFAKEDKAKREIEIIEGELQEIDAARMDAIRKKPLHELLTGRESFADLEEIRKAKKYHPMWSRHVMRERKARVA